VQPVAVFGGGARGADLSDVGPQAPRQEASPPILGIEAPGPLKLLEAIVNHLRLCQRLGWSRLVTSEGAERVDESRQSLIDDLLGNLDTGSTVDCCGLQLVERSLNTRIRRLAARPVPH